MAALPHITERAESDVPYAADDPAWSGPSPAWIPEYGCLFAEPAALGGTTFYFDRNRRHHACTYGIEHPYGPEIVLHGRRWTVKPLAPEFAEFVSSKIMEH
jgi:hypothetical protein